ncbi:MAG: fibronectin type III domain-containing protein, partial [Desulfobacterales bacterium]
NSLRQLLHYSRFLSLITYGFRDQGSLLRPPGYAGQAGFWVEICLKPLTSNLKHLVFLPVLLIALILVPNGYSAQVTLAWDPNQEPDVAGYKIHYGTYSRTYQHTVDVKNFTSCTISGLEEGKTYFFAATAYDTNGNQSGYSTEAMYTVPIPDMDGDGFPDNVDDFPTDPTEWLDTDGDGIGNNADEDDDDDGMPDAWEIEFELNPLVDDAAEDPDGDGISNLEEYLGETDPRLPANNQPPDRPLLLLPEDTESVNLTPVLQTDSFSDPDAYDTHIKSRWQILREQDDVCVLDVTSPSSLTALEIPKLILAEDTPYRWRVKFYDDHDTPSEWSEFFTFTTITTGRDSDGNGIPDHQEVDQTTDLDKDGIADAQQSTIKSLNSVEGSGKIGVSFKGSPSVLAIEFFESEHSNAVSDIENKPDNLPFGLLHFRLALKSPGNQAMVTIYFSENIPANAIWYKLDVINAEWLDFSDYAEIDPERQSVTLILEDGGVGDADGIANGIIVDPSGLSMVAADTAATAASSGGGRGADGCFIASMSLQHSQVARHTNAHKTIIGVAITSLLLWTLLIICRSACCKTEP